MKMYECPNCGELTFSYWQKQFLGPARTIRCRACDARVSVPWLRSSIFVILGSVVSLFAGLVALMMVAPGSLAGLGVALAFVVFVVGAALAVVPIAWLYGRYVHLVQR